MPRKRPTAAAYDLVAADYEAKFLHELDHKSEDRELLDALAARGTGIVVDVGSGPGQIGARLRGSGRTVIALDVSEEMARSARPRLDGAVVGDMLFLPYADGSVADTVAFYSLIHVGRHRVVDALSEFARVLARGGHVLVAARQAGFSVISAKRRPPYPSEGPTTRLYLELERP